MMAISNTSHTLLRRIAGGYKPTEDDFARCNGTAQLARTFAALDTQARALQGYDLLAKNNLSESDIRLILVPDEAQPAAASPIAITAGASLYERQFPPLAFVWDGLIARGHCVVLAGRPKSGKSWLMLQLAQAIDSGAPFIGKPTSPAKILYCALEDGERRIHQRLHIRKWQPRAADFAFALAPLDAGGIEQIEQAVVGQGYQVVFIDTLRAAISGKIDENDNAAMGNIVNRMAQLAHTTDTTIYSSHHLTKNTSEDPFDAIRGAGAIRGAYDVGLVLQRKQKEREALLCVESRDIEAEDMTISFDGATGWSYEGDAFKLESIRAGRKVVKALQMLGDGQTTEAIAQHLGISPQGAREQLRNAERDKLVRRDSDPNAKSKSKDIWSLTETQVQP